MGRTFMWFKIAAVGMVVVPMGLSMGIALCGGVKSNVTAKKYSAEAIRRTKGFSASPTYDWTVDATDNTPRWSVEKTRIR